jgi:hypothetical protein
MAKVNRSFILYEGPNPLGPGANWQITDFDPVKGITDNTLFTCTGEEAWTSKYIGFYYYKPVPNVPPHCTIVGIEYMVDVKSSDVSAVKDVTVYFAFASTAYGNSKANLQYLGTDYSTITYGSPTDNWGINLLPWIINSSALGFQIKYEGTAGSTVYLKKPRASVYYTVPSSPILQSYTV